MNVNFNRGVHVNSIDYIRIKCTFMYLGKVYLGKIITIYFQFLIKLIDLGVQTNVRKFPYFFFWIDIYSLVVGLV